MKKTVLALVFCASFPSAGKTTIDLAAYKNNKNFTTAETSYTVGARTFTLVNIRPRVKSDTACISAVIIDKRKLVLFDIGVEAGAYGLFVPRRQPLRGGLVVLKASPVEGKTFIFLSNGKLITLPGAQTIVDTTGKSVYCVWENDNQYRLTVFNYRSMRLTIPTTIIKQPLQWYASGVSYCFTAPQEKGYYSVEPFMKSVVKIDQAESDLSPVPYLTDFSKIDPAGCCNAKALKKQ
ncbi:MAG: hypothetical protein JW913_01520 [Chitinispirillaceae bacterium]|nr:hypothetical protein [Chitinispirillaceae bacterium]